MIEGADRAGVEHELRGEAWFLSQVDGGEDAQEVTVGHEDDVALLQQRHDAVQDVRRAGRDVLDRLTRGLTRHDAVAEDLPVVADLVTDLRRGLAFVAAVIPLAQVLVDLEVLQADEFGGAQRPGQRRDELGDEVTTGESLSKTSRSWSRSSR